MSHNYTSNVYFNLNLTLIDKENYITYIKNPLLIRERAFMKNFILKKY